MLENVVAWVLNNYVGEYLENLNTDQLSIALLSGQVELENVPLKKSALRKLDLPLEVKNGMLGKLTLSVPITHMRSEPWTLKLADVLIIVGPISERRYDVETAEHSEQAKKEQMLDELEKKHRKELLNVMGVSTTFTEEQESWWGASLIATVVNNIQLILTNVHIRYEDGSTLPNGLAFNCGVRIQKMTVQTTNQHWKPGFVEPQDGINVFKKLELKGFSLYWNTNQPLSENIHNVKDLQNLLAPEDMGSNAYIIEPCCLELRMEKNSSKLPLKGSPPIPRFKFWLRPEKIVVELSRRQMSQLRCLNREWSRFERARLHRKWRPLSQIKGNAREWWHFAYNRVVDDARRVNTRRTWTYALIRARHLNAYARAYRRRLLMLINNPTCKEMSEPLSSLGKSFEIRTLGAEDRTIMKQIERDEHYLFSELNLFRETVFRNLLREKEKECGWLEAKDKEILPEEFENVESTSEEIPTAEVPNPPINQGIYGWIASFFGGNQSIERIDGEPVLDFGTVDLQELKNLPPAFKELEKQVEEEILDVLHDSWDDSTVLRKDLLFAEIALKLDQLTLRFIDTKVDNFGEQRRVLAMDLMNVASRVELSPRTHTLSISLSVHDMSIQRLVSTHKRHREESTRDIEDLDESLMYSMEENTKVLLAVGRGSQNSDDSSPLFKMQYRRRSPRLVVRHTVEGSFRPISVMCDENALSGLGSLFQDDSELKPTSGEITPINQLDVDTPLAFEQDSPEITIESHAFVKLSIPNVCVVLRKRGWDVNGAPKLDSTVESFACVNIQDVHLDIVSKEAFVKTVSVGIGHMNIQDLFENTSYPLLSTKKNMEMKTVSTSCPDLYTSGKVKEKLSSSLPSNGFMSSQSCHILGDRKQSFTAQKFNCAKGRAKEHEIQREARVTFTLVDGKHPEFETRFSRNNCTLEMDLNEIEVGMNRRTWTALLEFAGLLGEVEDEKIRKSGRNGSEEFFRDVPGPAVPFTVACTIRMKIFRINMNYPANGTRLGVIAFNSMDMVTSIRLHDIREQMSVLLGFSGIRITDRTPMYSSLYDERIIMGNDSSVAPHRATINIVKFLGEVDMSREWDLLIKMVVPNEMNFHYVHTHRYFCGIMDFWMHFFELQDMVTKAKKAEVTDGPKSRVKLDIDLQSPTTIILPLNQLSDQVIVVQSSGLRVTNSFKRTSAVADIFHKHSVDKEFGFDNQVDCLLDCIQSVLCSVQLHEGMRVDGLFTKDEKGTFRVGRGIFENFEIQACAQGVFSEKFDLITDIYRNLDGVLAHNVPDLTMITGFKSLSWRLTTDFYCLLRGFLQCNLADPLIPIPDMIPLEILNKPTFGCEVGSSNKYSTFSLRIIYEDVCLDCYVPTEKTQRIGVFFDRQYQDFAKMVLNSARVSFDVFVDGQCELDLICESTQLIDTRKVQPGTKTVNVHTVILCPRKDLNGKKLPSLMSEAHIMLRKDEPPVVTLVLMNAKVILCPDWLHDAKEFVLLNTDFVLPSCEDPSRLHSSGIVEKSCGSMDMPSQTISLKITLRDSDLYILENPSDLNSFAFVLFTTAVLNMNDAGGEIAANLEIQSMNGSWCLMSAVDSTRSQFSNEFSIGIGIGVENRTEKSVVGLSQVTHTKHAVQVEIDGMIGKLSYRDGRVLRIVLDGWLQNAFNNHKYTLIPIMINKPPPKPMDFAKISVKTDHADFWILDDIHGSSIPMLRVGISNLNVDRSTDRFVASSTINIDYFNQRVFGWEPLVERWSILRFLMTKKEKMTNVELITETKSTLDVNLTQDFIQQSLQWSARWPTIKQEFDRDDFRSQCSKRSRSDHLPYVLKNETGSDLSFTTQVEDVLQARNVQRKATVKWLNVSADMEHNFEFPTKLLFYSHCERESPRQLLIRVDGWDEISPVNVDACGTYFRVVKAIKSGMANARLVVCVSMEKDGQKVVSVKSSINVLNQLPHRIIVHDSENGKELLSVDPSNFAPIPLKHAHAQYLICPVLSGKVKDMAKIAWRDVRVPGEVLNQTVRLNTEGGFHYWLCTATRREHYPEHESLPGHSITVLAPLTVLNLLPVDVEIRLQGLTYAVGASKQMQITSVNITQDLPFTISTDRLTTMKECIINK